MTEEKFDLRAPRAQEDLDPRARRTRERLGDALFALLQEKGLDSIKVQDVLDRAGVARATFYAHYQDKDDLFVTENDQFFEHIANALSERKDTSDRLAPVSELFAHVAHAQRYRAALIESGHYQVVMELGHAHFARGIERRLAELPRSRGLTAEQRSAAAHASAGALFSMLAWWLQSGSAMPASDVDALYHRMVWSGIGRD